MKSYSSFVFTSETMQVEFHGPGQGMPSDWAVAAYNWGRRSRGATVSLWGLGEVGGTLLIIMLVYIRYYMGWSVVQESV